MRLIALSLLAAGLAAQAANLDLTQMEKKAGFIPLYWDKSSGHLLMEVPLNQEVLYYVIVGKAIGSLPIGIERGTSPFQAVLKFRRVGPKVEVVQENLAFRAPAGNAAMQHAVEESFPESVLASLPIVSEQGGHIVVNAMPLLTRDAVGIAARLQYGFTMYGAVNEGVYKIDPDRSSIYMEKTKAFPRNSEVEVTLTYATTDRPGARISKVAPDPRSMTLRLHHSFVKTPEPGYRLRVADARIGIYEGYNTVSYRDYSKPYSERFDTHLATGWHLEKKDPNAAMSEPKKPIVYYMDKAIPEPVRSAMIKGALEWNKAFEAAGFKNAIQIKDPTPDMDPMDIRYPFMLWVANDERAFSSGGSLFDPRTGEVITVKMHMDMGRIRTISNYWKAYTGNAKGVYNGMTEEQFVLQRQQLLQSHELGHGLGFGHTWTTSMEGRSSVMEYPSPLLKMMPDGTFDLKEAQNPNIGDWDKLTVRYNYTEFKPSEEKAGLDAIVKEALSKFHFTPGTDPRWNRYDNLPNPADYLRTTLAERQLLIKNYGPQSLEDGSPVGRLRGMGLWMTYMHHRWAIDTGVNYIGSMYHNFNLKGDPRVPTEIVPGELQRDVLGQLMECLKPANLSMPESLLKQLTIVPWGPDWEEMGTDAGYAFSQLSAARTVSARVLEQMFQPERAARLIEFPDRDPNALSLPEVITAVLNATWYAPAESAPMAKSLQRVTQREAIDALMICAANPKTIPDARAVILENLFQLRSKLAEKHDSNPVNEAHLRQADRDLARFLANPTVMPRSSALPEPAGPPI